MAGRPGKCLGKLFLVRVNFWSEHTRFVVANGINILYYALRSKITLSQIILPSLGNFTQNEVDVNSVFIVNALELYCYLVIFKLV